MELYSCQKYYIESLQIGRGIRRDEIEAFRLLIKVQDAFGLAKAYYEGLGVKKDLIEASLLAWRASHNSNYDMCSSQEGCFIAEQDLSQKIDKELSFEQKQKVNSLKFQRYPEIASQQNTLNLIGFIGKGFIYAICIALILSMFAAAFSIIYAFKAQTRSLLSRFLAHK